MQRMMLSQFPLFAVVEGALGQNLEALRISLWSEPLREDMVPCHLDVLEIGCRTLEVVYTGAIISSPGSSGILLAPAPSYISVCLSGKSEAFLLHDPFHFVLRCLSRMQIRSTRNIGIWPPSFRSKVCRQRVLGYFMFLSGGFCDDIRWGSGHLAMWLGCLKLPK